MKIKINKNKFKNIKKSKLDPCPICQQHMDLIVTSHKNKPFVDNKLYPKMCFTCFCVPNVLEQKYDKNGYIKEEIELEYSIKNLKTPKELLEEGSADSISQAKKCVEGVSNLKVLKEIKNKIKPKMDFYINK